MLVHKGETVKQNKYLSFTLETQQIKLLIEEAITTSSGLWHNKNGKREMLPIDKRYSYKNFHLNKVLSSLDFSNYKRIEIEDYAPIDSWKNYCKFISQNKEIKKPSLLKISEWNEMGYDEIE